MTLAIPPEPQDGPRPSSAASWADLDRILDRVEADYPPPLQSGATRGLHLGFHTARFVAALATPALAFAALTLAVLLFAEDHEPVALDRALAVVALLLALASLVTFTRWVDGLGRMTADLEDEPGPLGALVRVLGVFARFLAFLATNLHVALLLAAIANGKRERDSDGKTGGEPGPDPFAGPLVHSADREDDPALHRLLDQITEALDAPAWSWVACDGHGYGSLALDPVRDRLQLPLLDLQDLTPRQLLALLLVERCHRMDPAHLRLRRARASRAQLVAARAAGRDRKLWFLDLGQPVLALLQRLDQGACEREHARQRAEACRWAAGILGGPTVAAALRGEALGRQWSEHVRDRILEDPDSPTAALTALDVVGPPPEVLAELDRVLDRGPAGSAPHRALLAELEALPEPLGPDPGGSAWDILFEDRGQQQAWLLGLHHRDLVAAAAFQVGLRRPRLQGARYRPPTLTLCAHGPVVRAIATVLSYSLSFVCLITGLVMLGTAPLSGAALIAAGLGVLVLMVHLRRYAVLGAGGLELVRPKSGWVLPWTSVRGLALDRRRLTVTCETERGRGRQLSLTGSPAQRYEAADLVLEHAPHLAPLAWATGLARVEPPREPDVELPAIVELGTDALTLAASDGRSLRFDREHPDFCRIVRAARERAEGGSARPAG